MYIINKSGLQLTNMSTEHLELTGVKVVNRTSEVKYLDLIAELSGLSKSEVRRKIKANAVWIGDSKLLDVDEIVEKGNVGVAVFIGKEFYGIIDTH